MTPHGKKYVLLVDESVDVDTQKQLKNDHHGKKEIVLLVDKSIDVATQKHLVP